MGFSQNLGWEMGIGSPLQDPLLILVVTPPPPRDNNDNISPPGWWLTTELYSYAGTHAFIF